MNKRGFSVITVIFWAIIFVILWALFFAQQLSYWGHAAVVNSNLTGVEALFYDNVNLVIGFCFAVFVIAFGYIGLSSGGEV